jgi:hypothetical protein
VILFLRDAGEAGGSGRQTWGIYLMRIVMIGAGYVGLIPGA